VPSSASGRRGKWRLDDDEVVFAKRGRRRALPSLAEFDATDGVGAGERWSTWDQSPPTGRGPLPHPDWLVTELAATDTELGVLKTGKEADVFLLRRGVPGTSRSCLLAAKRYRSAEHRQFHRHGEYTEGRRVRESRVSRAMVNKTTAGREMIAAEWAGAEFAALCQLHQAGLPVPYPVQIIGTEVLLEFIGHPDGTAAPRLADTGLRGAGLASLWGQLVPAMTEMARLGLAHGDMSAYNLLVHAGRLVIIDTPQLIDVIAHPRGAEFLDRDALNVSRWFEARGLGDASPRPADLPALLRTEARLR
jgi:RIO kinase 1